MTSFASDQKPSAAPPADRRALANALRFLAIDAVEAASSGHPGMPMGMADVATVLFDTFLKFDAGTPAWPDRDRFVLSAGHGSMLLYGLLHLTGSPGMDLEEIKNFRQLGSLTPGHPEVGHTPGVETTTGPLGQGLATAVGMALAERHLRARFGPDLVDHRTFVIASDGDLMEGVSHEAAEFAGHQRLDRLIVLYDDNQISIDGPTSLSLSTDQLGRFRAYGWHADRVDGHDPKAIEQAISKALLADRPALIACRTVIGFGAPKKKGTAGVHGAPLGAEESKATREALGWPHPAFEIPDELKKAWRAIGSRHRATREAWEARVAQSGAREAFERALKGTAAQELDGVLADYKSRLAEEKPKWATRKSSQEALAVFVEAVPEMVGGSADLTGSNLTMTKTMTIQTPEEPAGRYLHFGVREHGMAAALNGMALHGGIIPYGGTFLVFTDYCRPSIRLSALMGARVIFVMTHDSIGLGEDGPTHQPVEHLAALRAIPGLQVFRPADAIETAECWALALGRANGPSLLALTRQNIPTLRDAGDGNLCAQGAYVLKEAAGEPQVTLIATGSEVEIALLAQTELDKAGIGTRVVSMPCQELFEQQPAAYRRQVLGEGLRVAIEAAASQGWQRYIACEDDFIGMKGFGASGPYQELYEHFGITPAMVVEHVRERMGIA